MSRIQQILDEDRGVSSIVLLYAGQFCICIKTSTKHEKSSTPTRPQPNLQME